MASRCCQAEKCAADLSDAKQYHRRHKVCEHHAKAQVVLVAGVRQRFCQQCSRFGLKSQICLFCFLVFVLCSSSPLLSNQNLLSHFSVYVCSVARDCCYFVSIFCYYDIFLLFFIVLLLCVCITSLVVNFFFLFQLVQGYYYCFSLRLISLLVTKLLVKSHFDF